MGKTKLTVSANGGQETEIDMDKLAAATRDPMPGVQIKKAKIKDGLFLEVEYSENTSTGSNKVSKSCTAPIHDDLRESFKKLDNHLATICEQYDDRGELDIESISCRGYAVGGSGEHEGVTLMGTRSLTDEKVVNLASPFTKFSDGYGGIASLHTIVNNCSRECKLYLFEGKQKPQDQLSMFDQEMNEGGQEF